MEIYLIAMAILLPIVFYFFKNPCDREINTGLYSSLFSGGIVVVDPILPYNDGTILDIVFVVSALLFIHGWRKLLASDRSY
jgi:hypothetical protein